MGFEDQAVEEKTERCEGEAGAKKREVDLGKNDQVEKEKRIGRDQDEEAKSAPEKERRSGSPDNLV